MKQGSIEQRHGKNCTQTGRCGCAWAYRVDLPVGIDGKRRQLRKGGFRTKTAAQEARVEAQRRIVSGELLGQSPTVEGFLTTWLDFKAETRKTATANQYRDIVTRFLIPHLGRMKLADLRADHVEQMLAAMAGEGRGDRTRRLTLAVLSSALGTAMKRRMIPWNICSQVELPPRHKEPRKVRDEEQTRRFLRFVRDDRLYPLWRLYALSGLRRGEALALDWSDVDLDGGTLRVRRTLSETGGRTEWGTPKSQNGVRTIPLDLDTVAALRSHRARQAEEKLALGAGYSDHDLVFAREDGAPIWPGKISKRFHG